LPTFRYEEIFRLPDYERFAHPKDALLGRNVDLLIKMVFRNRRVRNHTFVHFLRMTARPGSIRLCIFEDDRREQGDHIGQSSASRLLWPVFPKAAEGAQIFSYFFQSKRYA
jgi:hypothetical protein